MTYAQRPPDAFLIWLFGKRKELEKTGDIRKVDFSPCTWRFVWKRLPKEMKRLYQEESQRLWNEYKKRKNFKKHWESKLMKVSPEDPFENETECYSTLPERKIKTPDAYSLWRTAKREELQRMGQKGGSCSEFSKNWAPVWENMAYEEKRPFLEKANRLFVDSRNKHRDFFETLLQSESQPEPYQKKFPDSIERESNEKETSPSYEPFSEFDDLNFFVDIDSIQATFVSPIVYPWENALESIMTE